MTKDFHVCGLGNAIVDLIVSVDDAESSTSSARTRDHAGETRRCAGTEGGCLERARWAGNPVSSAAGRSPTRSSPCHSSAARGRSSAASATIVTGSSTRTSSRSSASTSATRPSSARRPGPASSSVTPDAEQTMRTCLAVSSHLAAKHVDADRIKRSEWLFIEGYVFANPATGQTAIREAIRIAKANGTKVAITCSEALHPAGLRRTARRGDRPGGPSLLFANESESVFADRTRRNSASRRSRR